MAWEGLSRRSPVSGSSINFWFCCILRERSGHDSTIETRISDDSGSDGPHGTRLSRPDHWPVSGAFPGKGKRESDQHEWTRDRLGTHRAEFRKGGILPP